MTGPNGHDPGAVVVLEEPTIATTDGGESAPAAPGFSLPFATRNKVRPGQQFTQNRVVLIAAGGVVVALLLFVFSSAPAHKTVALKGKRATLGNQPEAGQSEVGQDEQSPDQQRSLFPVIESGRTPAKTSHNGLIDEQDVEQTATRQPRNTRAFSQPRVPQNGTLASIPPFDGTTWQAPPYQQATTTGVPSTEDPKVDREQPSLVFVRKVSQSASSGVAERALPDPDSSLGLPTGTRLRARLESTASTAVKTPVIAVVEYNYERNGEIVVPAGTKAFGHIEQADRSGYMSIRFNSLLTPDGSWTGIDAVTANLNLGPLRGKVEGKNTGKNFLVTSLSGIGEVGALLIGQGGTLNQPFSEADLLREQVSTNIGASADQEVTQLSITEHIVVSVAAGTAVYIVLDRSTKQVPANETPRSPQTNTANSVDSLRQLLPLQRELNQSAQLTTSQ
jgi:hypothetical protein